MLFNKITEYIMKSHFIEKFSKFKVSKANINIRLQARDQYVVKATDYITP